MTDSLDVLLAFFTKIDARINAACRAAGQTLVTVIYSAYPESEPRDNLDEIAIEGMCLLVQSRNEFYGGKASRHYCSDLLTDPTWLDLAVVANAMMAVTRDKHHCYLEGVRRETDVDCADAAPIYTFLMGS